MSADKTWQFPQITGSSVDMTEELRSTNWSSSRDYRSNQAFTVHTSIANYQMQREIK